MSAQEAVEYGFGWPDDWEGLHSGTRCPICDEGRVDETSYGIRFLETPSVDAYLGLHALQRGYALVVWRGSHATELTELDGAQRASFIDGVCTAAKAMADLYRPRKLNYELLGNQLPHLNMHVSSRYEHGDIAPGRPLPQLRNNAAVVRADVEREVEQLRAIVQTMSADVGGERFSAENSGD